MYLYFNTLPHDAHVPVLVTQRHLGETCPLGKVSSKACMKGIDRLKMDAVKYNQAACMSKFFIKFCGLRTPDR